MKAPREADILAQCLTLLQAKGILCWRSSNHAVRRTDRRGREFWSFHGLKGVSDILGLLSPSGRLLAVEVKGPHGKLRREQVYFLEAIRQRGGVALVVRDVNELARALEEWL